MDKRLAPPTPPQDPSAADDHISRRFQAEADAYYAQKEREHCERSAYKLRERPDLFDMQTDAVAEHIRVERAAAVEAYKRSLAVEPTADEREHCIRAVEESYPLDGDESVQLLLRERAAAYQAGYERGRAAGYSNGVRQGREARARRDRRIAELEAELDTYTNELAELGRKITSDNMADLYRERDDLQAKLKHTRKRLTALVAAAKNARLHLSGATGGDALRVLRALDAAIAEAEREGGAV